MRRFGGRKREPSIDANRASPPILMAPVESCCRVIPRCPSRNLWPSKPALYSQTDGGVRKRSHDARTARAGSVGPESPGVVTSRARISRPSPLLHRHHLQPALDCDGRGGGAERARHLGDRGASACSSRSCSPSLELSSRYPDEGGIYVWSKRAFGPFAGVHHRLDVLGDQPAVLPGAAVFRRRQRRCSSAGRRGRRSRPTAPTSSTVVDHRPRRWRSRLNVVGLNVGKWLNNVGALAGWIAARRC